MPAVHLQNKMCFEIVHFYDEINLILNLAGRNFMTQMTLMCTALWFLYVLGTIVLNLPLPAIDMATKQCTLECPRLWCITKNSLLNEGIFK